MTIKRLVLISLTVLAVWLIGLDLLSSWNQPQVQSRIELYQTNLLLQASELSLDDSNVMASRRALVGANPVKNALEQYEEAQQETRQNLAQSQAPLTTKDGEVAPEETRRLAETQLKLTQVQDDLAIKIGLLQTAQGEVPAALNTWAAAQQQLAQRDRPPTAQSQPSPQPRQPVQRQQEVLAVLVGLWSQPAQLLPEAERTVRQALDGWFRDRALTQLYQLQQRQDALQDLQAAQQQAAKKAFESLAIVTGVPVVGCLIGVGLLLFVIAQWFVQRKQVLLAVETMPKWETPWDSEVIWQVLIFGFFLVGQLILPVVVGGLKQAGVLGFANANSEGRAAFILLNYLLLAAGGLGVLYRSIQPYLPLNEAWFRFDLRGRWLLWGFGGYFAALPLVIAISVLNQKIWQGQGGSNPILPIALEERNSLALLLFFVTATIAAPIFEEILFRGFLLSSLTRYLPTWGAIALSSLIFAVAHLSLSEVLPLTVLGMVLGFVYVRSQNLLASMLLHGLWNSGTLLSLVILGSGQS